MKKIVLVENSTQYNVSRPSHDYYHQCSTFSASADLRYLRPYMRHIWGERPLTPLNSYTHIHTHWRYTKQHDTESWRRPFELRQKTFLLNATVEADWCFTNACTKEQYSEVFGARSIKDIKIDWKSECTVACWICIAITIIIIICIWL